MARQTERLTPARRNLTAHVINSIALGEHKNLRSVENLAASLDRKPQGLRRTLNRLIDAGYLELEGKAALPTVQALRFQDPELSEHTARRLLARARARVHATRARSTTLLGGARLT